MTDWIVVRHWERFQHYKDRGPAWIKIYVGLLHEDAYLELSGHQRSVLHGLWLVYASAGCQVPLNTASLTRQLHLRVSSRQLEALKDAGFIEFSASKPLAPRYTEERKGASTKPLSEEKAKRKSPSEESDDFVSPEEKKPKGDQAELFQRAKEYAAEWDGGPSEFFDNGLDSLERQLHARLTQAQRSELWDRALARDRARIRRP